MKKTEKSDHLVVVGSSAGGIEALSTLAASLDKDFPAPVVLAQHLDPNRPSQLAQILERRAALPIVEVRDQMELEDGKMYVVPSNRHVRIVDGHLSLEEDAAGRPRPSVDLLLSSAAKAYGERVIAVILTGSGSDGAAGAVEVKSAGGVVVIQDPRTAAHASMPMSLPPTAVDHVSHLSEIGPLLKDIVSGARLPDRIAEEPEKKLSDVLALVTRHASIDFRQYKPSTILRRIGRRMAVCHVHTIEEYRDYLETHPTEIGELVRALLIKVTEFFRDPEAFSYLEKEIMPGLIERGRERGRVLRLWSAGCATGEEAYSLALLASNMLGTELPEWSVKVFATDVDDSAISFARRGHYPENVLRTLPAAMQSRYFESAERGFRINKSLRQMVIFGQQDLSRGVPFPRVDLVTCRNLLIYFKPELQQEVLDLFAYSLHLTRGFLFLGKAETARPSKSVFELVNKKWKVYRCLSGPLPIPLRPPASPLQHGFPTAVLKPDTVPVEGGSPAISTDIQIAQLRRVNEAYLRHLTVGIAVIDRSYRIYSLNPTGRRLLGIHEPGIDQDLLHSASGLPYREVRTAIDNAFRDSTTVTICELELRGGMGSGQFISIAVTPLALEGGAVELALLCVQDQSELIQTRRRMEAVESEQAQLSEELGNSNRRLTEMNKELQDANEELQAANEEMMLSQEELQATNEEFEATNEELQATNEELETDNEELQATNEELETTNEELQARSGELQELTRMLSSERMRLSEMVELAPFQIVVLRGPNLLIEEMTPLPGFITGGSKSRGMPFDEACADPDLEPVRAGVRRSFNEDRVWSSTRILVQSENRHYVFTAVPSHDGARNVDGVVLYAEDVTLSYLRGEEDRLGKLRTMLEYADQVAMALFEVSGERMIHASQRYMQLLERFHRMEPGAAIGHTWSELWFGSPDTRQVFQEVAQSGEPARLKELRLSLGERASVWSFSLLPVTPDDSAGNARHIVVIAVEVTEPVLARDQLAGIDQLKNEFMALASHELRTPLQPLMAYCELLRQMLASSERGPQWEDRLSQITAGFQRQVMYMGRLTDDLLDIARLQGGTFAIARDLVDLRRVVRLSVEQASLISPTPAIRVLDEEDGPMSVIGDEGRLIQVFYNLLANAIRYAPESPHVDVRLERGERDGGSWFAVRVEDQGPGIPHDHRSGLFSRFFQVQRGRSSRSGLGLGLFISRNIIEQHGGRIRAEFPERGTRFVVELKAADGGN